MSNTIDEITQLEEALRQAELGPDPQFFEDHIADDAVLDGRRSLKAKVVAAHLPGPQPKFTAVEMTDLVITDHGNTAVVTCRGRFTNAAGSFTLEFMRVWLRQGGRWQIIAATIKEG